MNKRLFISKNIQELSQLEKLAEQKGLQIIGKSFIEFQAVDFEVTETFDIIFFSSPRSVEFFLRKKPALIDKTLICVGPSTSQKLRSYQLEPNLTLTKSGKPKDEFSTFLRFVDNKKVLFPISNRSLKSYSQLLPENQKIEKVIYSTINVDHAIPDSDYYIFTSPSNYFGFKQTNRINPNAKVIAWGDSTKQAIEETGVPVDHSLKSSTLEELQEYLAHKLS